MQRAQVTPAVVAMRSILPLFQDVYYGLRLQKVHDNDVRLWNGTRETLELLLSIGQ